MKKWNRNYDNEHRENNEDNVQETNQQKTDNHTDKPENNKSAKNEHKEQPEQTEPWFEEKPDPEEELENLRRELAEEKQKHTRTRADMENLRKRMEREKENQRLHAKKEVLLDLLTFLDYFDQARKQIQEPAAAEGINIMARQFYNLLYKHGVRPVDCLGEPFDPEDQEGIGYIETDQYPEGCVAEEITTGYKLGDILLRPARVMVAQSPAAQAEEENERIENNEEDNNTE
ncbi:MAG: nucleotide exchange factor GrpE [Bacillota bacterium]